MSDGVALEDLGLSAEVTADLSVARLAQLAATLDVEPVRGGEPVPLLWHWACFTPNDATSTLGADGHARLASPRLERYPRRMWGAGDVTVVRPLRGGYPATRLSELLQCNEVEGRSGRLLVARITHTYVQDGEECVYEEQTIVYRAQGPRTVLPKARFRPPPAAGWSRRVVPDERLLFRFSAVTFNSHRIHYDRPYATQVEGYPALVVHGPLSAVLIAAAAAAEADSALTRFRFRAMRPLFVGQPFVITGTTHGRDGIAAITRTDGETAVEATYTL